MPTATSSPQAGDDIGDVLIDKLIKAGVDARQGALRAHL